MSKIDEIGGGTFACFDDCGICMLSCCCAPILWGQTVEKAGEGSALAHCCLVCCIPCWYPLGTSLQQETIDKKMGGQGKGFPMTCLCQCLCGPCEFCNVARAVDKALISGQLKRGAPEAEEMAK